MSTSSPLFQRITTCSNAIRFLKGNEEHASSYEEVRKFLPQKKVTEHRNTNLIKASLEFLKLGFIDRDTHVRKLNIAMWIALTMADDQTEDGFSKAVCERFHGLDDFDRKVMEKIFNFSICNDRVLALLDNAMILKKKKIHRAIEHEFRAEFIVLFFNVIESLVRRGHTLSDVGYAAHLSSSDMEGAREIVDQHISSIATKYWPCFNMEVLKKPRGKNTLCPARGALPRVSIGCAHVDFDQATIGTLKDSLLDKEGQGEFLEMIFAAISHASNEPVVTYRSLKLESVKTFFLDTILDEAGKTETLKQMAVSAVVYELRKKVESLEEELSSVKKAKSAMYDKVVTVSKMYSSSEDKREQVEIENKRLKSVEDLRNSIKSGRKKRRTDNKSMMPENPDKHWMMRQKN